jgi:predicted phage-related endonuclease
VNVVPINAAQGWTLGGSEAAAACGVDPWRSRVALWLEKRGEWPNIAGEPALWGTLLEPVVFGELERRGFHVMPAPKDGFQDEDGHPWMIGHPDGFAEVDGEAALLEIKTAGQWTANEWKGESGAPLPYLLQLHHYFYITGYSLALLAVLIAGQRLETRIVHRDDAVIARMLDLEGEFIGLLCDEKMPSPDGSESAHDALREMFTPSPGLVVRADKTIERHVREACILRESINARKEQLAKHEQAIQAYMGEATELISRHDATLAKWTPYDRTALDTKALREAMPATFTEFSSTKTLRRFTLE